MRELMWHPDLYVIARGRPDFLPEELDCFADPWVQYKIQLNGGDDIQTESGKANLAAVAERLSAENGTEPLYNVYGVLERWDETMAMFDAWMPLEHNYHWARQVANHPNALSHGSDAWKEENDQLVEEATHNKRINKALAGDLYLYNEVILPMFDRKLRELND